MSAANVTPLPVADINAEHIALGAALVNIEDLNHLRSSLVPDDFTSGPARLTYMAILAVADRGLPVTKTTVFDELQRAGHPSAQRYITALETGGAPGAAPHYVRLIAQASRSRVLLAAAQRLQQLASLHPTDEVAAEERDAQALDITIGLAQDIETDRVIPDLAALKHQRGVRAEADKIRAREDARRMVTREQQGRTHRPQAVIGTQFLAQPDPAVSYRIDKLWPTGGRILLAAQYKAGKTTMVNNLVRSLVDAEPFLDHYPVTRQARRVILIDNELDETMLRRWMREQHIQRTDGIAVIPMRGAITSFDILDPISRREWADDLRKLDGDVLILDCLRPILDAFGLDENREAGRFLTAFDELIGQAGIPEAAVIHHMGHTGERSRGDSRLRDWPDVEWRLTREDDDPSSPRFFTAFGRDVDVPETAITYEHEGRRLANGVGSRREAAAYRCIPEVLDLIAEADPTGQGLSQRQIISRAITAGVASKGLIPKVLSAAATQHLLNRWSGPRGADMYSIKITAPTAPETAGAVDPLF